MQTLEREYPAPHFGVATRMGALYFLEITSKVSNLQNLHMD